MIRVDLGPNHLGICVRKLAGNLELLHCFFIHAPQEC